MCTGVEIDISALTWLFYNVDEVLARSPFPLLINSSSSAQSANSASIFCNSSLISGHSINKLLNISSSSAFPVFFWLLQLGYPANLSVDTSSVRTQKPFSSHQTSC